MKSGTLSESIMFTIVLILFISNFSNYSVDAKGVRLTNISQKDIGKDGTISRENLNNQGAMSDLQIIFCNANYNPCYGTDDRDYMRGDNGNNVIVGLNGNDNITSNAGDDEVWGNGGNDVVGAGDGNDRIVGGDGDDVVYGEFNSDVILGGKGNDHLYGGRESWDNDKSDDTIAGGPGMDTIFGGPGNDKIYQNSELIYSSSVGDGYGDRINCGAGNDEVWINALDKDYAIYCEVIHKGTVASKMP